MNLKMEIMLVFTSQSICNLCNLAFDGIGSLLNAPLNCLARILEK